MLKITQIKVPKYTLVLQKHLSKCGLQITTKILTTSNTKSRRIVKYMVVKRDQIMSRIRWSIVERVCGRTKINLFK